MTTNALPRVAFFLWHAKPVKRSTAGEKSARQRPAIIPALPLDSFFFPILLIFIYLLLIFENASPDYRRKPDRQTDSLPSRRTRRRAHCAGQTAGPCRDPGRR